MKKVFGRIYILIIMMFLYVMNVVVLLSLMLYYMRNH